MNKNTVRKITVNSLGILSVLGLIICFGIYRKLQIELIPANPVPSSELDFIGGLSVIILLIAAIYHVILFIYALQKYSTETGNLFLHSVYIVGLILSGTNILTDFTILTDIGHEYPYWDVSGYWIYLYLLNAVHLVIVAIGLVQTWSAPKLNIAGLFEQIRKGDDKIFRSMHQIGLISAGIGIGGSIWAMYVDVLEKFQAAWLLIVVILALFPYGFMLIYWGIRNSKKPMRAYSGENAHPFRVMPHSKRKKNTG
ncbi:MAG: hypothetical protein JEZ00_18600 [Anaerolineaceae bacterium]|nr:hypothetical protein [Anaerolineaceae bacterium]